MYRWTVCDPLKEHIIEKGDIDRSDIMETFQTFPWEDMLKKADNAQKNEIYYNPSLEFENTRNKSGIVISAIEMGENLSSNDSIFYVFHKKPHQPDDLSYDLVDQSFDNAREILQDFVNEKYDILERRFSDERHTAKHRKSGTPDNYVTLFGSEHGPIILIVIFLILFFLFGLIS
ncbi:MAG: hypothetical protein ACRBDL_07490 [Alphaproteobacteria bacterium]